MRVIEIPVSGFIINRKISTVEVMRGFKMRPIVIREEDVIKFIFQDRWSKDLIVVQPSDFSLGVAVYSTKEFGKPQVHGDHEILYIVSGDGEILLDDEIRKVDVGTAIYVPPGCKHAARVTSQEPLKVVYVHASS